MNERLDWLSGQWLPNCTDLPQMIEAASNHGCDVLREGQLTVKDNSQAVDLSGNWKWFSFKVDSMMLKLVICCRVAVSYNNLLKLIPAHWLLLTLLTNMVLSLMNTSLSLTKYLLSLNLPIIIFVNFVAFVLILTSKLPVPSPLLLFILNLTTAAHCTIIFHSLR